MRVVAILVLMAFPLLSKAQDVMDALKRSGELYDEGIKYFEQNEYMIADSLFAESLKLYPHPDTYFNRAVARKRVGDEASFAQNLERAMELGDTAARNIYYRQCTVADTFYLTKDNKQATLFDFYRCIVFRKSIYTSYQEVQRFAPSGEVDLKYLVKERDTLYYMVPGLDSLALKSTEFSNNLKKHLQYPPSLKDQQASGVVWVNFLVEKDGSISDIIVVKSNALAFSAETITAIRNAGKFPVVYHEGKPVRMKLTIPVMFTFTDPVKTRK